MKCRHCKKQIEHMFLDLGHAPPSNAYLQTQMLIEAELYFPLKLRVCSNCWLVQTEDYTTAEQLFDNDYAYFSSTSSSWLAHAAIYVDNVTELLGLTASSHVLEVASNDGYLLKNFIKLGIPCIGIEPTKSTAEAAEKLGVSVIKEFFSNELACNLVKEGKQFDLVIGNNVFAHVPDINDFISGLATVLKPDGVITLEFPHLLRLIEGVQFDTVYHEHFSYFSIHTVKCILENAGLRIWDVEELNTHGGSLRVFACLEQSEKWKETNALKTLLNMEESFGIRNLTTYKKFQREVNLLKNNLLLFLIDSKNNGKKVSAYGAAAKGNTLLNYAGIKTDLLSCVYDAAPSKQGKYMPGSHIPILSPSLLKEKKPDVILILPWNISKEIVAQHDYIKNWGGQFVVAVPELSVVGSQPKSGIS